MEKQCAPLLFCGCRSVKTGRAGKQTRERSAVWRVKLAVSLLGMHDVLRKASWNSNWAHYGHHLEWSAIISATCGKLRWRKDSCRPYGPVCYGRISIHTHLLYSLCYFFYFFFIPLPCFSSPSAHLNRSISKLELGLIWGPQIDCILQPGCGDLWWKWMGMVWAGMQRCILWCAFFYFFCWLFFLILGGADGLENGVDERNSRRIIFPFQLRDTERLQKEIQHKEKKKGQRRREGNRREWAKP